MATYNIAAGDVADLLDKLAIANPDDIINMADGNYDLTSAIVVSRSGTAGHPIIWQATNYRMAVIRLTTNGRIVRMNGSYWNLKNFVVDGQSAWDLNEGVLTIGRTDAAVTPHHINLYGMRCRKAGAAGFMIDNSAHDIYISDMHIDGTGYVNTHGEGIYVGSGGGVTNVTMEDSLIEDVTENIFDVHPSCSNIVFNRITGRNQTTQAAHGAPSTSARNTITVSSGASATFTDVRLENNNCGDNLIWCGSSAGTVTFTRLIVNGATVGAGNNLIHPSGSTFTMTDSQFWNVNNTTVDASSGGGSQSITNTCGTTASGAGNAAACPIPSTPRFWQRQEQFTANGTTAVKAFTLDNTAGSILVATATTGADVNATSSVSDTRSNTWTRAYHSGGKLNVYYALNVAAGANTVTFNAGATTSIRLVIEEYRGVDASTVLASSNSASGATGTVSSGNVTTGQDNNLLLQSGSADSPITLTKDSNFTLRFFNGGDTLLIADRVPVTGTYSATLTQSGAQTIRSGIANFGPPTATGSIEVGSAVNLADGDTFTINWSSTGLSENVDIFLSRDGGTTYETIVSNTADDGMYDWVASGGSSSNCLFKVCGHTSTSVCGVSPATFRKKGKYN